jgi:hypothetical protein
VLPRNSDHVRVQILYLESVIAEIMHEICDAVDLTVRYLAEYKGGHRKMNVHSVLCRLFYALMNPMQHLIKYLPIFMISVFFLFEKMFYVYFSCFAMGWKFV